MNKQLDAYITTLARRTDHEDRAFITNLLEAMAPEAVPDLLEALNYPDEAVRCGAAQALGLLGIELAIPALVILLDSNDSDIRYQVALVLGTKFRDIRGVVVMNSALDSPDRDIRVDAAYALFALNDTAAIPGLVCALSDRDREVRRIAVAGLSKLGDSQSLPLRVLLANCLTPEIKLQTLEQMRRVRYKDEGFTLNFQLPAIANYCRNYIGSGQGDPKVLASAAAVLLVIENRAQAKNLVRACDATPDSKGNRLLRAVQPGVVPTRADQQLRASDRLPDTSQPGDTPITPEFVNK